MDRLREASRRGNHSGGPQISALRRPRSGGFKESAAADDDELMEDLHSVRLRERPRKEASVFSASRHKRTRHGSRELHSRIEEVEETEGGEVAASDEDDVPISPSFLPRKPTKLRFHGKVASDEGNAVEIPAVPRKARTAISKRPHESSHGDIQRHHSFAPAPLSSSVAAPSFSPSGPASKPMKRMKYIGSKLKAPKHTKVLTSVTISEQEVEVAEALFDLARMVSNLGSPLCNDDKMEVKMENGESTTRQCHETIPTPPSSHSAVSSPVRGPAPVTSSCISSSEAPTRKISLLKMKIEDGTHCQSKKDSSGPVMDFKSVVASSGQSIGPKKSADGKITASSDNVLMGESVHHTAAASISVTPVPSLSSQMVVSEAKTSLNPKSPFDATEGSDLPSNIDTSLLTAFSEQKLELGKELKVQDACDPSALYKEKKLKTSHSCKYEIDLMASPNASASGASEKTGNSLDSTSLGPDKRIQDHTKDSCPSIEKHDTQCPVDTHAVKEEGMPTGSEREARLSKKLNEDQVTEEKLRENGREKQSVELSKQELPSAAKNGNPDSAQQLTADGSGWPGSLPHMGYYPSAAAAAAAAAAAVAASWPATGSVVGAVSMEDKGQPGRQVPPISFPNAQPLSKRCATHVYIAHFIDTQQQMQRHPIWAATYGNTATGSVYPMKPYNPNAPLPPNAFFGGGLTGLTGLSVNNSTATKALISEPGPQSDKVIGSGLKEKGAFLSMDGLALSSQPGYADPITPLQAGLGSMLGYPRGGSSSVSAEAGGNNGLNTCSSGVGATAAVTSCPVSVGASTGVASTTDCVNAATAQVQYLQAIIQQAGFPFSFPPGHLMPPTTGHITQQQATQFFSNPFYNPPFLPPQQGPATGRVTPRVSSPQGQSTSMQRDVRASHSVSQQHQQQQQQLSSASSSQSHQRVTSQHLQNFGDRETNLGGETVSSAESKFPGYPKNMHGLEVSHIHASNIMATSSLHSAGMPVLPAQVALAAKQVANAKLPQSCGQGHAQQHSQNIIPHHHSMGIKSMDFQSPQTSSSMPMGVVNKNMVGPGPLGLASVAAVMAPQGHTVLQTMGDTELAHLQAYQEQSLQHTYSKFTTNANLEGSKSPNSLDMVDNKRTPVKQGATACTPKMDIESESSKRGSSGHKSGLPIAQMQQNHPGASFNFMTTQVGNSSSRQVAPVSVGCITSTMPSSKPVGVGRANSLSNMTGTAHESSLMNKLPSSSVPFHVPNVSCHQGIRQGQTSSQYSSQTKPVSRMQVGSTGVSTAPTSGTYAGVVVAKQQGVSTAPSSLLPGTYAVAAVANKQGYSAKNQQASVGSMQSRLPPTASGSSNTSVSPSTSVSKSNSSAAAKNIAPGKGTFNSSQKQASAAPGKRPDAIPTHSPGQVVGPPSITVSMGQSQQHSQHQHIQHVIKQQQQQWQQQPQKQQYHNVNQEHSQQVPQSMHQQLHVTGVPPTGMLQYHQASGASQQVSQAAVQKQSAQSQQMKQRLYLEQHMYQPQQQQSQLTEPQHSARPGTQQQFAHHGVSTTSRPMQQVSESLHQQAGKHQAIPSHQQPFSLASFGASSSGAVLYSSSGNVSGGRPASSEGALAQVTNSKSSASMKPPGGTGASVIGSNTQRSNSPSAGFSHLQGVGAKVTDAKSQPQGSSNISYLPYFNTATFSSSAATVGKSHGASFLHSQVGGSVMSMRDPSAGTGREESASHQFDSDRASPASVAPLMSGNSHSSTVSGTSNVQVSVVSHVNTDVKTASRATPLGPHAISGSHASGQASQTCTVTSATMTADSISTTG